MTNHSSTPAKPTRWWHSLYYGLIETVRHQALTWIATLPAPTQFVWRNRLFRAAPAIFESSPQYRLWKKAQDYFRIQRPNEHQLINLEAIDTHTIQAIHPAPRIAIHAHLYYADMAPLLASYLAQFPHTIDLFISNPKEQDQHFLYQQFCEMDSIGRLEVRLTPNQGRDIAPMIDPFGKALLEYDLIAHIHSKKSVGTNDIGQAWCDYLWKSLLGNEDQRLQKIWSLLQDHSMIYPEKFHLIDVTNCLWGEHLPRSTQLCQELHIAPPAAHLSAEDYIEFPVGSMFWARADALAPLLGSHLTYSQFETEDSQTDQTLSHTIERNLARIALSQGMPIGVLENCAHTHAYP